MLKINEEIKIMEDLNTILSKNKKKGKPRRNNLRIRQTLMVRGVPVRITEMILENHFSN